MTLATLNRRAVFLRAAWLALLVVLGSQLFLAGHQFQHEGLTTSEACTTCMQLDQLDVPVATPVKCLLTPQSLAAIASGHSSQFIALPLAPYSSRAPPRAS